MRLILITLLLFSFSISNAQKAFIVPPSLSVALLIDTTTKTWSMAEFGDNHNVYSLSVRSTGQGLMDCLDGKVYIFSDTLVPGDFSQQGSTGIYKITPHAAPLSTAKRNILVGGLLLQYDNSTHELHRSVFNDTNYPVWITKRSTGETLISIYPNNAVYGNFTAASFSVIGSVIVKYIVN